MEGGYGLSLVVGYFALSFSPLIVFSGLSVSVFATLNCSAMLWMNESFPI